MLLTQNVGESPTSCYRPCESLQLFAGTAAAACTTRYKKDQFVVPLVYFIYGFNGQVGDRRK
jgi:hypothetical protein